MRDNFESQTNQLIEALRDTSTWHQQLNEVIEHLKSVFSSGHKVLVAGNGGAAAVAQHLTDEMVGKYRESRPPLPVATLTADGAVLTCIANDFGFQSVFARQVEALGQPGDILIVLSTSGESENLFRAIAEAKMKKMTSIAFTGARGSLARKADLAVVAPSDAPPRIQELHLHAIHLICEKFEPASNDS